MDESPISKEQAQSILDILKEFDSVLGVMKQEEQILDEDIEGLIQDRQDARKNKDFAAADAIRDKLAEQGIILEDTRDGVRWKRR